MAVYEAEAKIEGGYSVTMSVRTHNDEKRTIILATFKVGVPGYWGTMINIDASQPSFSGKDTVEVSHSSGGRSGDMAASERTRHMAKAMELAAVIAEYCETTNLESSIIQFGHNLLARALPTGTEVTSYETA